MFETHINVEKGSLHLSEKLDWIHAVKIYVIIYESINRLEICCFA